MLGHYTTAPGAPSVQLILLVRIDHTRGKIILSSLPATNFWIFLVSLLRVPYLMGFKLFTANI